MSEVYLPTRRLRISVRSALAGFLVYIGFQELIAGAREPLAAAVITLIRRIKPGSVAMASTTVNWLFISAELVFGFLLLVFAFAVVSSIARRK